MFNEEAKDLALGNGYGPGQCTSKRIESSNYGKISIDLGGKTIRT